MGGTCGALVLLLALLASRSPHASGALERPLAQAAAPVASHSPTASGGYLPPRAAELPQPSRSPASSSSSPAARALDDYLAWAKYPPSSRPAEEHRDALQPSARIPSWHRLDTVHPGVVMIRQSQDALYLAPGETAVVTLSATVRSHRVRSRVLSTRLTAIDHPGNVAQTTLAQTKFHDDGQAPDRAADDDELTAEIHAPPRAQGAFKGDLRLQVELTAEGESGSALFALVCTGDPPARFTGAVREQLEQGSLALYVGMEILRAGRYVIEGRLDDASQRPIALLRFTDTLDSSQREVRLLAFGKLLRDRDAVSPYLLRDLRGWRLREGLGPDRELLQRWQASHTTRAYPLNAMSDSEWESPSKSLHVAGLRRILTAQ